MPPSTASIQVGKAGVTEGLIKEIRRQLKQKSVKVRLLRSFASKNDRKKVKEEIESLLGRGAVMTGNTLFFRKK